MSLLGIDIGTTGCKAIVFREDGEILAGAYREYPLHQPQPGWMELDPRQVWGDTQDAIREAVANAGAADPVRALSTSVQGEAVTPVAADGEILANSPVTFDERTLPYAGWWDEHLDRMRLFQITGMPPHVMYTINKIMWWRREQPEVYERAAKFLNYGDFALHQLGLPPTIDFSMAGRSMAFDLQRDEWSSEILAAADIDVAKLPEVAPSGTAVGVVPDEIATDLGLPSGVVGVTGGHDQPCGALGGGITEPGLAIDATGTVECITPVFDQVVLSEEMLESNYCCYHHVSPGLYTTLAFNFTGGSLLRWYRDHFAAVEKEEAEVAGMDVYDILLGKAAGGPSPVMCLPHFTMTGTPWFDTRSRGAFLGLTLGTQPSDVVKAILDGVTYEMRLNLDRLAQAGIEVKRLRGIGGGAKSGVWMQLKADIFNRPVARLNVSEGACLGAAILAGVGAGVYPSTAVANDMVREVEVFEPNAESAARHQERYELYRDLYPTLQEFNHRLAALGD